MNKRHVVLVLLLGFVPGFFQGCDREEADPALQSSLVIMPAGNIQPFSASVSVTVHSQGIFDIIEKGVCWNVESKPRVTDEKVVVESTSASFSVKLDLPEDDKEYFVRPYLRDDFGNISYGNEISFKTLKEIELTITSKPVTDITEITATLTSTIVASGEGHIKSRGVCWAMTEAPTVNDFMIRDTGSSVGEFSVELKGLAMNRKYFARAFGISGSNKITYGNTVSFTTLTAQPFNVTVQTVEASATTTTATSGGKISGTGNVAARGVCWSTIHNPTIRDQKTINGKGLGEFASALTGLTSGTTYFIRAYATSNLGVTVYGNEVLVVTLTGGNSAINTSIGVPANISLNAATVPGGVQGYGVVVAKGICWSTSENPTVSDNKQDFGSGFGNFAAQLTGLTSGTTYYVRAYAIAGGGTFYSTQTLFTTLEQVTISTTEASSITQTGALSGGNITTVAAIKARGVCWSTSSNPTIDNSKTNDGSSTGSFASSLTGLMSNTVYYVRAYAISTAGSTYYGNQISFRTTASAPPQVTTTAVTGITKTSAVSGGAITGSAEIIARGVCWSTSVNPLESGNRTIDGSGTGTFTSNLSGLGPGTIYYVRAYAKLKDGTITYGLQVKFNTAVDFTVTTATPTDVSFSTAKSGGAISGTGSIQARGVCWSTSLNPTIADPATMTAVFGNAAGTFSSALTGLNGNTTYYVRAFAQMFNGIVVYGDEKTFKTTMTPIVTTSDATAISQYSAILGGTVTSSEEPIVVRGVLYSTSSNPTWGSTSYVNGGSGTGSFSVTAAQLRPNTLYYIRAFIRTSSTTTDASLVYGSIKSFRTAP